MGNFPLSLGWVAVQTISPDNNGTFPFGQTGVNALPYFLAGVSGVQILQHGVIHRNDIHQGQRTAVPSSFQSVSQGNFTLKLSLRAKVHQDLIFDTTAGVCGQPDVFVRLEGGNSFDQTDGADGDQIVLIAGLGVIFFGQVKQKDEFSRSKTTP